jgi:thiamine biosynthesis lipoprotein
MAASPPASPPCATRRPTDIVKRSRPLLGTFVAIGVGLPDAEALGAIEAGFAAIADVHRLMSFHEPDSDVSRLNRAGAGNTVAIDPGTFAVLSQAQRMAEYSNGIFDITVAPDLVAWGFLPRPPGGCEPDATASWRDIALLPSNTVRLRRPLWIDLGGIAKGYAVDRAIAAMDLAADVQCSVNASGDLRIQGPAPERILLRAPADGGQVPVVELENASLASSSGRDDLHTVAGEQVGPHVHGGTHCSIGTHSFVSVVARDCMTADALTKIVLALGSGADGVLKAHDATAYLHDGQWRTFGAVQ